MSSWIIRFRSARGISRAIVKADTLEEAERLFAEHMDEAGLFGVPITTQPHDPLASGL